MNNYNQQYGQNNYNYQRGRGRGRYNSFNRGRQNRWNSPGNSHPYSHPNWNQHNESQPGENGIPTFPHQMLQKIDESHMQKSDAQQTHFVDAQQLVNHVNDTNNSSISMSDSGFHSSLPRTSSYSGDSGSHPQINFPPKTSDASEQPSSETVFATALQSFAQGQSPISAITHQKIGQNVNHSQIPNFNQGQTGGYTHSASTRGGAQSRGGGAQNGYKNHNNSFNYSQAYSEHVSFNFVSNNATIEEYINLNITLAHANPENKIKLYDKIMNVELTPIPFGNILALLHFCQIDFGKIEVDGQVVRNIQQQQIVSKIKFYDILSYSVFLHFGHYRICESSPHRVIAELQFQYASWSAVNPKRWVLFLPEPKEYAQKWYAAYIKYSAGTNVYDSQVTHAQVMMLTQKHQQTYDQNLKKSEIGAFPQNYRFRTEDLDCSLIFMSCPWRKVNAQFNATPAQLAYRENNIQTYSDQQIMSLRNYPVKCKIGERLRGYVNGPRFASIYLLDTNKNGKLEDKACLDAVRQTRLKVVETYFQEHVGALRHKTFDIRAPNTITPVSNFADIQHEMKTLESKIRVVSDKLAIHHGPTKCANNVNDQISKVVDYINENRSTIALQNAALNYQSAQIKTLSNVIAYQMPSAFCENSELLKILSVSKKNNFNQILTHTNELGKIYNDMQEKVKAGEYVQYQSHERVRTRVLNEKTRGVTEHLTEPKAINEYPETIASLDLFKNECKAITNESGQEGDTYLNESVSSSTSEQNPNQIRYDSLNNSEYSELPELARIDDGAEVHEIIANESEQNNSSVFEPNTLEDNDLDCTTASQPINNDLRSSTVEPLNVSNVENTQKLSWPKKHVAGLHANSFYKNKDVVKIPTTLNGVRLFFTVMHDLTIEVLDGICSGTDCLNKNKTKSNDVLTEAKLLLNFLHRASKCLRNENYLRKVTTTSNFGNRMSLFHLPPVTLLIYQILHDSFSKLGVKVPVVYDVHFFTEQVDLMFSRLSKLTVKKGQTKINQHLERPNKNRLNKTVQSQGANDSNPRARRPQLDNHNRSQPTISSYLKCEYNISEGIESNRVLNEIVIPAHELIGTTDDVILEIAFQSDDLLQIMSPKSKTANIKLDHIIPTNFEDRVVNQQIKDRKIEFAQDNQFYNNKISKRMKEKLEFEND